MTTDRRESTLPNSRSSIPIRGVDDPEVFDIGPGDRQPSSSATRRRAAFRSSISQPRKIVRSIKLGRSRRRARVCGRRDRFCRIGTASLVHVIDVASGAIRVNVPGGSRPRRFAQASGTGKEVGCRPSRWLVYVLDGSTYAVASRIEFKPKRFSPRRYPAGGADLSKDGRHSFHRAWRGNRVLLSLTP